MRCLIKLTNFCDNIHLPKLTETTFRRLNLLLSSNKTYSVGSYLLCKFYLRMETDHSHRNVILIKIRTTDNILEVCHVCHYAVCSFNLNNNNKYIHFYTTIYHPADASYNRYHLHQGSFCDLTFIFLRLCPLITLITII